MGKLAIMFFINDRMAQTHALTEQIPPALRALRRLSLRSSLPKARRAGGVRLCSHTCPGLNAQCSPLLAARQEEEISWGKRLAGCRTLLPDKSANDRRPYRKVSADAVCMKVIDQSHAHRRCNRICAFMLFLGLGAGLVPVGHAAQRVYL